MDHIMISYNLHRIRKDKKMSQDKLAEIAGISRVAYKNIEGGNSIPRVSTLLKLASALNVKLEDFLVPARVLKHVRYRSLKRMNRRDSILIEVGKWLDNYNSLEELLDQRVLYQFAGLLDALPQAACGAERAKHAAARARDRLGLHDSDPIRDIAGLLEDNGIKLFPVKLVSDGFFGLSVSEQDGGPAIIVNVWERISVERWIFSAAHELGHLLLHLDSYDVDQVTEDEDQEKEANEFASFFLMPEGVFNTEWQAAAGLDLVDRVIKITSIFNVSYKTVLYRLSEKYGYDIWRRFNIAFAQKRRISLKGSDELMALASTDFHSDGHSDPEMRKIHEPEPLSRSYFVEARLSRLVRLAIETENISLSRGAEILGHDLLKMREIVTSWV